MLDGLIEVAEHVFNAPVRLGVPGDLGIGRRDRFADLRRRRRIDALRIAPRIGARLRLAMYELRVASKPIGERVKSFFGIRR